MSIAARTKMMIDSNFTKWDALTEDMSSYYQQMDSAFIGAFEYAKYAAENKKEDIVNLGHDINTMLISCKFNGYLCSTR